MSSKVPSDSGSDFIDFFKRIPSKISAMWNHRKVSYEKGTSAFSKIIAKMRDAFKDFGRGSSASSAVKTPKQSAQPLPIIEFDKARADDHDYIIESAKENKSLLLVAGPKLKNDPAFILDALQLDPSYAYYRELLHDPIPDEIINDAKIQEKFRENLEVQQGGYSNARAERNLQFTPKNIAREYLEDFPEDFRLANELVRGDAEIAAMVIKESPKEIEFVRWENMTAKEIEEVLNANPEVQENPVYFQFAPKKWFEDNIKLVEDELVEGDLSEQALMNLASRMPDTWNQDKARIQELAGKRENLAKVFNNLKVND